MPQPAILLVADDARVLDALTGDLARRFGSGYLILARRPPWPPWSAWPGRTSRSPW
jgi:hypothetical protein